ncbi:hypothetical protein HK102_005795 [Quaeritorhiza haematococci]|nr:hypothetical protein HK102_005795 [Quaeritorhiza haematococci]
MTLIIPNPIATSPPLEPHEETDFEDDDDEEDEGDNVVDVVKVDNFIRGDNDESSLVKLVPRLLVLLLVE